MHTQDWRGRNSLSGIVPALIVIGIGALFLLNNLNIFFIRDIWRFWPGLLIALGLVKLVDSPAPNARITGGVLVGVGALFLADNLGFLHLSWENFWPLVLIGVGLIMLWSRLSPPLFASSNIPDGAHEGTLNENSIFGGVERKVSTDDFRGGPVSALFGGVVIDLRNAGMRGDCAAIDVNCIFGGIEIKVPRNWIVVSSVTAVFGGVANNTAEPAIDMPGVKRLYLKGAAVFGGVEVKN